MFADNDCARFFASKFTKNLRAFAIKAVAKCDTRRDRLRPPIAFDVPIFSNVAHEFEVRRRIVCASQNDWSRPALRPRREGASSSCSQAVRMRYYVGNFPDA